MSTNFRVDGKIALVTGAGRGIGLAMVKALAAGGAAVAIQDIELTVAQKEADAINASGWVNTYRNRADFASPEDLKKKGRHIPIGGIAEPEDHVGIALLLCSEAGSYITGQSIYVDGGLSAR